MITALAACVAPPAAVAQMPAKPGPEHEIFRKMVGTWDATMNAGGMETKGVSTYKMDLGGLWLASTYEGTINGEKFSGRGFDSYDADKKKYVGVWMDSMSASPMTLEGTYDKAKKTMTMAGEGPGVDGSKTKYRMTTEMPNDDTMNFTVWMGDAQHPSFTIKYKRRK
jgi:hypothetical protein